MASKPGGKDLFRRLDRAVSDLYACGVFQSCIVHTAALLVLALTILVSAPPRAVRVSLSFDDNNPTAAVDSEPALDLRPIEGLSDSEFPDDLDELAFAALDAALPSAETVDFEEEENLPILEPSALSEASLFTDLDATALVQLAVTEKVLESPSVKASNTTSEAPTTGTSGGGLEAADQAIAGAIGERLRMAGAKTGDVQISIGWNTVDDIDLHVQSITAAGLSWINWMSPFSRCGGELDVDMNAAPDQLTNRAVENIYWPFGQSPRAEYVVGVHLFRNRTGLRSVPVAVVIKVGEATKVFNVDCVSGRAVTEVTRFTK